MKKIFNNVYSKNLLKLLIGAICAIVIVASILILTGSWNGIGFKSMETFFVVIIGCVPCLAYAFIIDDEKYNYIAIIATTITVINGILQLLLIWFVDNDTLSNIVISLFVFQVALALISYVLGKRIDKKIYNIFTKISITTSLLYAIITTVSLFVNCDDEIIERISAIFLLFAIGSLIVLKILQKNNSKENKAIDNKVILNDHEQAEELIKRANQMIEESKELMNKANDLLKK